MITIFTIVSNNYLAYAKNLMRSVREFHPDAKRHIIIVDGKNEQLEKNLANIIYAEDLAIYCFSDMAFRYSVMEMNTAVKPYVFQHLLKESPENICIYLDPDIEIYNKLSPVIEAFDKGAELLLTPHITKPLEDEFNPQDIDIMRSGIYNLGFAAMKKSSDTDKLLKWWAKKCEKYCVVNLEAGIFTDQKWMDMAPAFVENCKILHDTGLNIAYWNLLHRNVSKKKDKYFVDKSELIFFHFSGVNPLKPEEFSKHQNRFNSKNIVKPVLELYQQYIKNLLVEGWEKYSKSAYKYGFFKNGRIIHPLMRLLWCELSFEANPFESDHLFDEASIEEPKLTNLALYLWKKRTDLTVYFANNLDGYIQWFLDNAAKEENIDHISILAQRKLTASPTKPKKIEPLFWASQSKIKYGGNKDEYLQELVSFKKTGSILPLPRHFALIWEIREDLQEHFPHIDEASLRAYFCWCLTSGLAEKSFDIAMIASKIAPYLDRLTNSYELYQDVPVTNGMMLFKHLYNGQYGVQYGEEFPSNFFSRSAIALFYANDLVKNYAWPENFASKIIPYFNQEIKALSKYQLPISNLMYFLWNIRPDLKSVYQFDSKSEQERFICWFIFNAIGEYNLADYFISGNLRNHLLAKDGRISNFHKYLWLSDNNLRQEFDIYNDQEKFLNWFEKEGKERIANYPIAKILFEPKNIISIKKGVYKSDIKRNLLVTGYLRDSSGRSETMRLTRDAFISSGLKFLMLDRKSGEIFTENMEQAPKAALDDIEINIVQMNADTAISDYLFLQQYLKNPVYQIGYWSWELAKFPEIYNYSFSFYDEIWAETKFIYDAYKNSSSKPVYYMPIAVEAARPKLEYNRGYFDLPADKFIFLYGFDFRSYIARKNPEAAISAFQKAFPKGDENAVLFLKTLGIENYGGMLETSGDTRIIIRNIDYKRDEMISLISLCDCYFSPHRAEGFGRGPAEAMLLGKALITTGYSGNMDFTNKENSLLIDYNLIPVNEEEYPGYEDQVWANIDIDHAASLMQKIYADKKLREKLGKKGQEFMRNHHNSKVIGENYKARIKEIESLFKNLSFFI